jgi:hypothetical protein
MARYVAWLGQLGTIKASSLQPYLSAINGFFKDHGLEAVALGDLVAKVRKGLTASHVAIDDTPIRVHLPTSVAVQTLRVISNFAMVWLLFFSVSFLFFSFPLCSK